MTKKDFIKLVKENLKKKRIKLIVGKGYAVMCEGLTVGGYFDEANRVLKIRGKGNYTLGILVHEYCHFLQMMDGCAYLKQYDEKGREWEEWLSGELELPQRLLHNNFLAIRNYELDCEKRAAKLIEKLKLPVDVGRYIQGANAYMFFLAFVKKTRTWPQKLHLRDREILDSMPKVFLKANQYNSLPEGFEDMIKRHSSGRKR
jgi:hypothetical protein